MDTGAFLNFLTKQKFYDGQIAHVEHIKPRNARYGKLEQPLLPELENNLKKKHWLPNDPTGQDSERVAPCYRVAPNIFLA